MDAVAVDVEELAVPAYTGDRQAVQGGRRRVEGLQRADGGDVDAGHDASGHPLAQVAGQRLDLGQLRHESKPRREGR